MGVAKQTVATGLLAVGLFAPLVRAAEPTAHDPQFANRQVWPLLTGKEAFVTQKWEPARLLVWAHPGTSAKDRRGRTNDERRGRDPGLDREDPATWLENGRPATAAPEPGEAVDLWFPASDRPYQVASPPWTVRHMTIERGAYVMTHPKVPDRIRSFIGNIWLKRGGGMYCNHDYTVAGAADTFIRNDNEPATVSLRGRERLTDISYWLVVNKQRGASVELLGNLAVGDEFKINEGLIICGPDSRVKTGPASINIVGPEATLELQSGSYFAKRVAKPEAHDLLVQGRVRAGSPERPLTRDATLAFNFKIPRADKEGRFDTAAAAEEARKYGSRPNKYNPFWTSNQALDYYGLIVVPGASLTVHSADPAKARLVIRWNGAEASGRWAERYGSAADIPRKINMLLLQPLELDGVLFDDVQKGGILMADPARRTRWKHVYFGPRNAGKPDELFAAFQP